MTKERMFYIAYRICDYMRNREMQNQFEEHEFCMYVSDMVNDIDYAIKSGECDVLHPYYEALNYELNNVCWNNEYVEEVKELIDLLDECKNTLYIYKTTI